MTSMPVFQPSKVSLTPRRKALLALSYAKAAIEKLEAFLSGVDDTEIPAWVFTRINQAATCFGQASDRSHAFTASSAIRLRGSINDSYRSD